MKWIIQCVDTGDDVIACIAFSSLDLEATST